MCDRIGIGDTHRYTDVNCQIRTINVFTITDYSNLYQVKNRGFTNKGNSSRVSVMQINNMEIVQYFLRKMLR